MKPKGYSLIEILVVISVFSIVALIATQSILVTLTGAKKSESTIRVRENLEYATSVMERRLRNANSIDTCSTGSRVDFTDGNGNSASFYCQNIGGSDGRLLSESGRITSSFINLTECSITCPAVAPGVPSRVNINLSGKAKDVSNSQSSPATISTIIYLRVY
jgi:prepilin-type N-terminal cleavage/methylation domain-containing protein